MKLDAKAPQLNLLRKSDHRNSNPAALQLRGVDLSQRSFDDRWDRLLVSYWFIRLPLDQS
jgi:hypothetical protein